MMTVSPMPGTRRWAALGSGRGGGSSEASEAIAFESLVKLVALLAVGVAAVLGVFGGLDEMNAWLAAHPEATRALYAPINEGPWATLVFLAFAAAFLLPDVRFHPRTIRTAMALTMPPWPASPNRSAC